MWWRLLTQSRYLCYDHHHCHYYEKMKVNGKMLMIFSDAHTTELAIIIVISIAAICTKIPLDGRQGCCKFTLLFFMLYLWCFCDKFSHKYYNIIEDLIGSAFFCGGTWSKCGLEFKRENINKAVKYILMLSAAPL